MTTGARGGDGGARTASNLVDGGGGEGEDPGHVRHTIEASAMVLFLAHLRLATATGRNCAFGWQL
jgi:hypothetical protein